MATVNYKIVGLEPYMSGAEAQLNTLGASGYELAAIVNTQAILMSGSSGITVTGSLTLPGGVVSSSTQASAWSVATASYVAYDNVVNKPTLVSSSTFSSPSQGTVRTIINGSTTDVNLGVQPGDTVTFASVDTTGNITAGNNLISNNSSGDEGGEILLAKAQTNTTLTGSGITIDSYQNKLRIFEQGGTARGGYFDITTLDTNAGTDLTKVAISKLGYGQWYSVRTQSGSVNVSSSITYDSQSFARGFTLISGSRITALQSGTYNFQFSLQLKNASNDNILYYVWFKQNGINDDWSTTTFEVDKQPSTLGAGVAALNYMTTMTSGSYLELVWSGDNAGASIFATGSVNGRPGIPSAIITVAQVA